MISTSDGSQAKAQEFLKSKSQKIMEYMPELQKARIPDALARTEGSEDQSIRGKLQKGTITII